MKALFLCFFALDHNNYALIHICDMENLPASILAEFKEHGNWDVLKTRNRYSVIPAAQKHEQNNEHVKGSGGGIGLTGLPSENQFV